MMSGVSIWVESVSLQTSLHKIHIQVSVVSHRQTDKSIHPCVRSHYRQTVYIHPGVWSHYRQTLYTSWCLVSLQTVYIQPGVRSPYRQTVYIHSGVWSHYKQSIYILVSGLITNCLPPSPSLIIMIVPCHWMGSRGHHGCAAYVSRLVCYSALDDQSLVIYIWLDFIWLVSVAVHQFISLWPLKVTQWPLMQCFVRAVSQPLMIRVWFLYSYMVIWCRCSTWHTFPTATFKGCPVTFIGKSCAGHCLAPYN